MIPKKAPKVQTFPPLKLYREDLDRIVSAFVKKCKAVTIADEEFSYESLDEMAQKASPRLNCFHLTGILPHAELVIRGSRSVQLGVQKTTLWIIEQTDESNLLFLSVKDLLLTRIWRSKAIINGTVITAGIVVTMGSILLKSVIRTHFPHGDFASDAFGVLGICLFFGAVYLHTQNASYIALISRTKADSFWKRNYDKILLVLITAGFTEFIHWLISRLTR
jgi:hypothetical protein